MSCLLSNLKPAVAKVADDEPREEENRNEGATLAANGENTVKNK